jgi:hypothetical protein
MSGGIISGNNANEGGGVFTYAEHFTMSGTATIGGNNANSCGGVYGNVTGTIVNIYFNDPQEDH